MSIWNSKYAILKDLSLAQGCEVPTDLDTTIAAGERPPAPFIVEEDDYFHHCFGNHPQQDCDSAPDCELILQMLELVQNKDIVAENSGTKKKSQHERKEELNNDSTAKSKPCSNILLNKVPSSMFRKKASIGESSTSDVNIRGKTTSPQKNVASIKTYQPSTLANEYCQQFVERNKMRNAIKEDIWSDAIRVMNEIDSKKKLEAEMVAAMNTIDLSENAGNSSQLPQLGAASTQSQPNYGAILLPQHRHLLTGECTVCKIFKKNGIIIDDLNNTEVGKVTLCPDKSNQEVDGK